jgi:hypothetical protein
MAVPELLKEMAADLMLLLGLEEVTQETIPVG